MHNGTLIGMERIARWLISLPRARKRALMLLADTICIPAALWTAILLKTGEFPAGFGAAPWLFAAAVLASIPIFVRLGLYRAVVRFIGPKVIFAVVSGVTASVLALAVVNLFLGDRSIAFSAIGIYWALALVYVGGSRIIVRNLVNSRQVGAERVIIYGAGSAGAQAAAGLRISGKFDPVAFLDDDASLQGSVVAGIEVHAPSELARLIEEESVGNLLLALPSQTRRRRQEILKSLEPFPVRVMTVPDIADQIGRAHV